MGKRTFIVIIILGMAMLAAIPLQNGGLSKMKPQVDLVIAKIQSIYRGKPASPPVVAVASVPASPAPAPQVAAPQAPAAKVSAPPPVAVAPPAAPPAPPPTVAAPVAPAVPAKTIASLPTRHGKGCLIGGALGTGFTLVVGPAELAALVAGAALTPLSPLALAAALGVAALGSCAVGVAVAPMVVN
ncbi:membrane hypothetical protein [uncultured Gammaproteobacteria bacterium]